MGRLDSGAAMRRAGVGAAGLLVLLGAWVLAAGDPHGWEVSAGRWAHDQDGSALGAAGEVVMQSGTRLAPVIVAVALVVAAGWRWRAVALLAGGAGAWIASTVLKDVVDRARPATAEIAQPGFPSSHAAISAAVAVGALLLRAGRRPPWLVAVLLLVPAVTAFARMVVGAHWLLDVVGGVGLGTATAAAAALAVGDRP